MTSHTAKTHMGMRGGCALRYGREFSAISKATCHQENMPI